MTLKSLIAEQATTVFLNSDHFAESIAYRPAAGGSPRTIDVVIDRRQSGQDDEDETTLAERLEVFVVKDAATGITSAQLQLGDSIDWNGATYTFGGEIVQEDEAAWTLIFERRRPWQVGGRQVQR